MKGYKVFNPNWTCREKQYSCPGVFEQEGELELCKNGIHFCKDLIDCFNYYSFNPSNKVAEIEAIGETLESKVEGKYCTSKIKIIRELNWNEVLNLVNTGDYNTGLGNIGNRNTGNFNTGDYNIGFGNSGNYNTGDCNSGYYNSGDCNTGDYNSGNHNIGNHNTGNHNIGNYNTGDYNIGDSSSGYFNIEENKIKLFNKQSDWTHKDWVESKASKILKRIMNPEGQLFWIPSYKITEEERKKYPEYLTPLRQKCWNNLPKEDKESVLSLPNFDAKIFKKITGIDVTIEK